ncbi:hypothetical protein GCM10011611_17890 [Aliidongia dinghuensis]|uniref:Uncharacterized protein n=2 Tax=Aliidongia dinghuensis TaxID=1867774 RepID=A0A8J2YSQ1_9PROT|nr:hypothetical protein GCM10011611_17890 [Aliidongia dinghuensis]
MLFGRHHARNETRPAGGSGSNPSDAPDACGNRAIGDRPGAELAGTTRPSRTAGLPLQAGLRTQRERTVQSILAVVLGICPPVVCAWIAQNSANWDLFERSGSITATIGLVAASRRYMQHSILELAALHESGDLKSDLAEVLEDIFTGKLGLALSGFGMIIWGWGKYLGWWSFSYLVVWGFFILRDARRDFIRLQNANARSAV